MIDRLVLLLVVVVLVAGGVLIARWLVDRQRRRRLLTPAERLWQSLNDAPDGRSTLVAFSSRWCASCHADQAPAIELASQELGAQQVRVIAVDVKRRPEVANAFGVLTVPSTAVLDRAGRLVALNEGFAPSQRLIQQLGRDAGDVG